ncbi:hypothetical protein F7R91_14360 [Streptomyces luteolifulvus]|uniref:Uncharacterized protein n=1 Tax=Streptomyces luteolifulvus TaxID=2615112 RepID=A0A6H9V197_9ACTN|nr:hypothetical protein [Streptomyces luteolifulvus]KAB1146759.1 hypothetical protein F7R91_14360 [Streptomyces luteolifulvus]
MTAPAPALSPTAGLFDSLVAHLNRRLADRISELLLLIDVEIEIGHEYRTARDYADSAAAGYIDRTDIWGTQ